MSQDLQKKTERVQARPSVTPRVDVFENKDEVLLLADLPGVIRDALKLNLDDDQIELEAQVGRFDYRRSFAMPPGIDREKVTAELRDGVLRLHLPKSGAARPRRIAISAG